MCSRLLRRLLTAGLAAAHALRRRLAAVPRPVCWPFGISVRTQRQFALTRGGATLRLRGTRGCRAVVACTQ